MYDDTIAAIATATGPGGVAIVRISGPNARAIGQRLTGLALEPRQVAVGWVTDPDNGAVADQVLTFWMPNPHSYTGEDVVELQGHGGAAAVSAVLQLVLRQGARLAKPGEFTLRAYLNGRIDLTQAEAVLDIVNARTLEGLHGATAVLGAGLTNRVRGIRSHLLDAQAQLVAMVDFPEDDVPPRDLRPELTQARDSLEALLATAAAGIRLRQGATVALAGRPNVGKSSLLNALVGSDRAIVTPVAGTTRDTLEATVGMEGIPVTLIDTAGIRDASDQVEQLGVARSRAAIATADLVLLVLDTSVPLTDEDRALLDAAEPAQTLGVLNKTDLPGPWEAACVPFESVAVSATTGSGLARLRKRVARRIAGMPPDALREATLGSDRQRDAVERALAHVDAALAATSQGLPSDFITIDVGAALQALGEVTGENASEELLDRIFSKFCIGK